MTRIEADGHAECPDCTGPSRRLLLRSGAVGGLAASLVVAGAGADASVALAAPASAAAAQATDTLVVLSLRGGFDGLSAVVPGADADYRAKRPTVGLPSSHLLSLDGTFGLHPVMAPLLPLWRNRQLAIVQDVGQAAPTRSHFEAMRELERAAPGSALRTGWMDRLLGSLARGSDFQGAQIGTAKATDAFKGSFPELALRRVDDFTLAGTDARSLPKVQKLYRALYAKAPDALRGPARVALDAVTATSRLKAAGYTPANGATYPTTGVGQALRDVARLLRAGLGVQVACVDVGEWDLHASMGTVDAGKQRTLLGDLADAIGAFTTDLSDRMDSVTLITLSEFGRRVAENGSGGTDHGHGNCVFVVGGGVNGGVMYGRWPGLATSALMDGDLPGTTDYRQLLAEIATKRLGTGSPASVFPGLKPAALGVVRARG